MARSPPASARKVSSRRHPELLAPASTISSSARLGGTALPAALVHLARRRHPLPKRSMSFTYRSRCCALSQHARVPFRIAARIRRALCRACFYLSFSGANGPH
ncbi:hypothetical protein ACFPRL_05020 [Pseudoclavibacter helvolus]